tara:strand:- start:2144 stop:2731 length:588 start_codon:yes stop_codon:yes gene_type:complete
MKILIVPKIREPYKNQIEIVVDIRLFNFFRKVFPKSKISFAFNKDIKQKYDLLILSGGNNLSKFSKTSHDKYRSKLDNFYLKYSIRKKIPIIGICHGAHFIANKYKCKISKSLNHLKEHNIIFLNSQRKISVNSYHNYIIKRTGRDVLSIAVAEDKSIELFKIINKKIYGIMWHPERYKKFKKVDIDFIKEFTCN